MSKAQIDSGVAMDLTADDLAAIGLVTMEAELIQKQAEVAELRKLLIARLPEADDDQLKLVVAAARNETELPAGCKPGVDFRISEAQAKTVKLAREARVAYLSTRKAEMVNPLVACQLTALTSFKVRVGPKATTTSARFVKKVAAAPKTGLIAALRASLAAKGWEG